MPKKPRSAFPEGSYTVLIGDGEVIGRGNWAVPYTLVPSGKIAEMKSVIEDLRRAIGVLPCYWREFVGEDLAKRVDGIIGGEDEV
jgi:hypothetical protein